MNDKKKVIILGAGIGALTTAHELSKYDDFDIVVYERNEIVGGLARSKYHTESNGYTYPVEYSWRVYGSGYLNLLRVLNEIPLRKNETNSVFDNLIKISSYVFPRFDKKEITVGSGTDKASSLMEGFDKDEKWKVINKLLYCMSLSTDRMNATDYMTWGDFCSDLSVEANKYMVRMWGPVLGMDPTYMSFAVVARIVQVVLGSLLGSTNSLYLMNKPTNDGWFDEWISDLESKGVTIKTNSEILDLKLENNKITEVKIKDAKTGEIYTDTADYIICGLSVESVAEITKNNNQLLNVPSFKNTIELAKISRQIQLSIQVFIDKTLIYPTGELKNVLYLPDTPWAIIIEDQSNVWGETYSTDPRVKSVFSVGICQTDVPGILIKKAFVDCTPEEVQQEVWAQIYKSYKMANIKTESGEGIETANVILFYTWDTYQYNQNTKKIDTWEPKFSNNAKGFQYQPNCATEIDNFFYSTAYTKTQRFIYSMESAAEAGTLTANLILKLENKKPQSSIFGFNTAPMIFKPLQWLDSILFKLHLPHLSKLFFGSNLALVITYFLLPILIVLAVIL